MIRILAIAILLNCLGGCVTEKQRLRICQSCTLKESVKDSIGKPVTTYMPFDTTAWIADHTGKAQTFTNCDSLLAELARNKDSIVTKEDGVQSTITEHDGHLTFRCKTDSLQAVIKLLRAHVDTPHYITDTKEVPARCDLPHLTKWDSFQIIGFRILAAIMIVGVAILVLRKKF